jgi:hypothetical protein
VSTRVVKAGMDSASIEMDIRVVNKGGFKNAVEFHIGEG